MASTVFDHDPSINHIEAMIVKDDGVVGIKFKDATSPNDYPEVAKIGKTKDFVHELVRGAGERIVFQVIKDFEQVTFKADAKGGFRKASIFRSNPLLAMMGSGGFEDLNEGGNTVDADGDQDGDFSASGDKQDEDGDNEDQSGVTIVE
eukprot:gene16891-21913_t